MSSKNGFQRVIGLFLDKELQHDDTSNPLIILGREYSLKAGEQAICSKTPSHKDSLVIIKPKEVQEQDVAHTTSQDTGHHEDPANKNSNIKDSDNISNVNGEEGKPSTHPVNDFRLKLQLNINSFFNIKPEINETPLHVRQWPTDFLEDVNTRIWLTYRVDFPLIPKDKNSPSTVMGALMRGNFADINSDGFSTDCGWGCMIRTSQSLLANTLLTLHVGRNWRYKKAFSESNISNDINPTLVHDRIISWFVDDPVSPFSIHNFVKQGSMLCGKSSGEWFGPSAASRSIQALCSNFPEASLNVYIGTDSGEVYEKDFLRYLNDGNKQNPVLLLLGVRLGIENVNKIYYSSLKQVLLLPQSSGIAGGRPSSSHYFFGYQGDYLFFLDPHVSHRTALKLSKDYDLSNSVVTDVSHHNPINKSQLDNSFSSATLLTNSDIDSVHTTNFNKLHLSEMDPSMLIGFLIKDHTDWADFKTLVKDKGLNKIVHIVEGSHNELMESQLRRSSLDMIGEGPTVLVDSGSGIGDEFVDLGAEFDNYISINSGLPKEPSKENISLDDENKSLHSENNYTTEHCHKDEDVINDDNLENAKSLSNTDLSINQTWENVKSDINGSYENINQPVLSTREVLLSDVTSDAASDYVIPKPQAVED